jgi:predicted RNase H-like nuclease
MEVMEGRLRRIRYLGLDLGWTPRDSSGGVVLEPSDDGGVRMISAESLRSHEDTLRWITRNRGRTNATLTINAPIIVENLSGARPCDRQLLEHFSRYRIDEYANNTVSASHPRTMGRALMRMGFDPNPASDGDRLVETHTQAAQVLLFGVDRPVRLKAGPIGGRKEAVQRLRELIDERLIQAGTPRLHRTPELDQLMEAHLPDLNGTRLGELEERLEALICGYVGAYLGQVGADGCAFLGDLHSGYILLPDPSRLSA